MNKRVLLWFRNDLRLHDNEALCDALDAGHDVIPVYVIDPRVFHGETKYGFRKTAIFRAKFIIESLHVLKRNLQVRGSDLVVRIGHPEEEVFEIAKEVKSSWVFCNRERTQEELDVQDALERNLWSVGQEMRYSRGKMLYYTADLPFPVTHTPDSFTSFRKEVEKMVQIREPLATPDRLPTCLESIDFGDIPSLRDLGYTIDEIALATANELQGGEDEALRKLYEYIWEEEALIHYKNTRQGLNGENLSTRLSAYLSSGCLSPKKIYKEALKFEKQKKKRNISYALYLELLWRDFFRLMGKKHGNPIFQKGGIKQEVPKELTDNRDLFKLWAEGRTGIPIIDASICQLNQTGYITNRSRMILANFLIDELQINWQIGAEYFESLLIDYDPCSNWGNWNYMAGIGLDPKEVRQGSIIMQARRYDPEGSYIKRWLPELGDVPVEFIHEPHLMSPEIQEETGVLLVRDYPKPCVRLND